MRWCGYRSFTFLAAGDAAPPTAPLSPAVPPPTIWVPSPALSLAEGCQQQHRAPDPPDSPSDPGVTAVAWLPPPLAGESLPLLPCAVCRCVGVPDASVCVTKAARGLCGSLPPTPPPLVLTCDERHEAQREKEREDEEMRSDSLAHDRRGANGRHALPSAWVRRGFVDLRRRLAGPRP